MENSATTSGLVVATGPDGEPDPSTPLVGIDGTPLTVDDTSDTESEPDANDDGTIVAIDNPASVGTGDDPTVINLPSPSLEVVKTVEEIAILFPTIEQVTFTIDVQNTGNVIQTGIDVRDDLAAFVAPAVLVADHSRQVVASGFTDGTANAGFDGVTDTALLSGNPTLAPDETGRIKVTVAYSTATGAPGSPNTGSATSDQLPIPANGIAIVEVTGFRWRRGTRLP